AQKSCVQRPSCAPPAPACWLEYHLAPRRRSRPVQAMDTRLARALRAEAHRGGGPWRQARQRVRQRVNGGERMYVSRLSFYTRPGHTEEVARRLRELADMIVATGLSRPRVLRVSMASPGAPDLQLEQEIE